MRKISFFLALLMLLSLAVLPAAGTGEAQIQSGYYGVDPQAGLVGQIAPGTDAETLCSRLFSPMPLSAPEGVKTGAPLYAGEQPAMTLVVLSDCSGDGAFSITDMLSVKSMLLELTEFTPAQAQAADCNGDGSVTITDFLQMKQQILGTLSLSPHAVANAAKTPGLLLAVGDSALWGEGTVTVEGDAVSWSGGMLTAVQPGTARLQSGSEATLVTVCSEPLQLQLPEAEITLRPQETFQLSPQLNHPMDAPVTYSVSDSTVATVSETGLITALEKGSVTVTATLPNGSSASQTVTVRSRHTVCIDAGHQKEGIYTRVPVGPGATGTKTALSGGTQGKVTGIPEHVLNLAVALLLKEELLRRGYDVIMIRETDTCPMTNPERAIFASESGADIYVRIHADGSDNLNKHGAFTCAPSMRNPFLTKENIEAGRRLSQVMVDAFCARTDAYNRGIFETDDLAGCNWCTIPSTVIEMGFMSNAEEDLKMATDSYRELMMLGIADGIDAYFAEE